MKYNYETMPKSEARTKGMHVINGELNHIRARMEPEDIIYQRKNGKNLKLRLIYPDAVQMDKTLPLIIHIQGSSWFKQNLNDHIFDLKKIVTSGYILAIVEYLPIPEAVFPSQVEDAKTAVRYLYHHAEELGIDTENLFLSGDSSGGHTALICWATWESNVLDSSTEQLPSIRACIDLYGIVNFVTITEQQSAVDHAMNNSPDTLLLNGSIPSENHEVAEKASVPYYLKKTKQTVPLLIMHGNKDTVVPFEQSVELYEQCKQQGVDAEFYCIDNADHGGPVFYVKEVLDTLINFLDYHKS